MAEHTQAFKRWELLFTFISALISLGALIISLRAGRQTAGPNIALSRVDGSRDYSVGHKGPDSVTIIATVALRNHGNSPIEIVDVHWEPLLIGTPVVRDSGWLAISDVPLRMDSVGSEFDKRHRQHPVLGIQQTVIRENEEKLLYLRFSGFANLLRGSETPNIRVVIVFSSGVELAILPEIQYSGVGMSF
jgi:hypothetical protein